MGLPARLPFPDAFLFLPIYATTRRHERQVQLFYSTVDRLPPAFQWLARLIGLHSLEAFPWHINCERSESLDKVVLHVDDLFVFARPPLYPITQAEQSHAFMMLAEGGDGLVAQPEA